MVYATGEDTGGHFFLMESLTMPPGLVSLLAVDANGGERLLGEYTFEHTRTIPGPAGWSW